MKKKFLISMLLITCVFSFVACKKNEINIQDYLIEDRQNLFIATDDIYTVTLSSGLREVDYCFDGIINEKTDFAILSLLRNDNKNLANDTYSYTITIAEEQHTGFLQKSEVNNSYSVDLQLPIPTDALIDVQISFTGYSFCKSLENLSCKFNVDNQTALTIANEQLKQDVENILKTNNQLEVVTKILSDNSTADVKNYYWYVGIISNNGKTMGILIDSNSGEILAKKV